MIKMPSKPTKPTIDEQLFESFWSVYPKRPNNSKFEARKSWVKAMEHATPAEIMQGLARYAFDPDPKLRPMTTTFLNQRRYECVNENLDADQFGLAEYLEKLPRDGTLSASCYDVADIRPILIATGWPPAWRGSLETMNAWLRDGYVPDSCAKVIADAVAEFGGRGALAAFDKRVRFRAERIVR